MVHTGSMFGRGTAAVNPAEAGGGLPASTAAALGGSASSPAVATGAGAGAKCLPLPSATCGAGARPTTIPNTCHVHKREEICSLGGVHLFGRHKSENCPKWAKMMTRFAKWAKAEQN